MKYFFVRDTNGKLLQMIDYKASSIKAYTYIHDVHGSIIGLADNSGNIVVSYGYDAWGVGTTPAGNIVTGSGELLKDANPFRYSGYQYDWETGLYYLKARYYSPGLGRFLTVDPVIGINRYMYAANNPVNLVDDTGLANTLEEGGSASAKSKPKTNPNKTKIKANERATGYVATHERSQKSFSPELRATLELEGSRINAGIEKGIENVKETLTGVDLAFTIKATAGGAISGYGIGTQVGKEKAKKLSKNPQGLSKTGVIKNNQKIGAAKGAGTVLLGIVIEEFLKGLIKGYIEEYKNT